MVLGFGAGAALSGINLWILRRLAALLSREKMKKGKLVGFLLLKFGLFYPAVIALLLSKWVSPLAFVAGFVLALGAAAWRDAHV